MKRRAFFFPHALQSNGHIPGRVLFDVSGTIASFSRTREANVQVFADGYETNVIATNQDPCVFSRPVGPFHSFCRIDSGKSDDRVREANGQRDRILPQIVEPGDIVIYGKFEPRGGEGPSHSVWVDTVIIVERRVRWQTDQVTPGVPCNSTGNCKAKKFRLHSPATFVSKLAEGTTGLTDAYAYNLQDAEPNGMHCCTRLGTYQVILGRVAPTHEALSKLDTSFVPLARRNREHYSPATVDQSNFSRSDWLELVKFIDTTVRPVPSGPRGGWIAEFPALDLATTLCHAIIAASDGEVAIPPLTPIALRGRIDPRTKLLTPL